MNSKNKLCEVFLEKTKLYSQIDFQLSRTSLILKLELDESICGKVFAPAINHNRKYFPSIINNEINWILSIVEVRGVEIEAFSSKNLLISSIVWGCSVENVCFDNDWKIG